LWNELSLLTGNFADFSVTPLSCISPIYRKISADSFKISLDGHGGDECLMGYPDMIEAAIKIATPKEQISLQTTLEDMLKNPAYTPQHHVPFVAKVKIAIGKIKKMAGLKTKGRLSKAIEQTTCATLSKEDFRVPDIVEEYREHRREMKKSFFGIHKATLELERLPLILRNFDKASMFSGVEIRAPFLDYRLVEFCSNLPLRHKINRGYTKYILRKTMDGHMPPEITWRKHKIGINAPLDLWMKNKQFLKHCKQQIDDNNEWLSYLLEIPKATPSLFEMTKDKNFICWFFLNLSLLK